MTKRSLLVIDVQNIYTRPDGALAVSGAHSIVKRINKIIKEFEQNAEQIIFIRHVHRADGSDLGRMFDFTGDAEDPNFLDGTEEVLYDDRLYRPSKFAELTKNRYSAFVNTPLNSLLQANGSDTVFITGFMTNYCCETTARDAHDRDYFVDFMMDATGCPDASDSVKQGQIKKVVGASLAGGVARVHAANKLFGF